MKPLARKLRGAQRVVALQADVERLLATAEQTEAAANATAGGKASWPYRNWRPEEKAARAAYGDFRAALLALHAVSPKRALSLATKLGLVRDWWEGMPIDRRDLHRATYLGGGRPSEFTAGPLPIGRGRADQRKLRKILEAQKQAAKKGR